MLSTRGRYEPRRHPTYITFYLIEYAPLFPPQNNGKVIRDYSRRYVAHSPIALKQLSVYLNTVFKGGGGGHRPSKLTTNQLLSDRLPYSVGVRRNFGSDCMWQYSLSWLLIPADFSDKPMNGC